MTSDNLPIPRPPGAPKLKERAETLAMSPIPPAAGRLWYALVQVWYTGVVQVWYTGVVRVG